MGYEPTAFQNGGPPAISAEELNKMGEGIKTVNDSHERLAYDIYNLMQEQYYLGNTTVSPSFGSARSIFFDPLIDESFFNSSSSAEFDSRNDRIQCEIGSIENVDVQDVRDYNFNGFTKKADGSGTLYTDVSDLESGGKVGADANSNEDFDYRYPVRMDLGGYYIVTGVRVYGNRYDATGGVYAYHDDGSEYIGLDSVNYNYNGSEWTETDFSINERFSMRYVYVRMYGSSDTDFSRSYATDVQFKVSSFVDSLYKSNSISLEYSPSNAIAFVSTKEPTGTSVEPFLYWGESYVYGDEVDSRPDPNFSGFTEIKYEFDLSSASYASGEFRMDLSTDGGSTPYVKRYGLYFF